MYVHHVELSRYGCPNFYDTSKAINGAMAFCWCGLDASASISLPTRKYLHGLPHLADAEEANEEDSAILEDGAGAVAEGNETDYSELRALLNKRAVKDTSSRRRGAPKTLEKACYNKKDGGQLKTRGKAKVEAMLRNCAKECTTVEGCTTAAGLACFQRAMQGRHTVSSNCASCFGAFIHCSDDNCIEQCACGSDQVCQSCNDAHCKAQFDQCSGLKGHDTSFALNAAMKSAPPSTNEGEHSLIV